jgi:uncharacterized membrane protein YraQ (UPF0718 family)
MQNIKKTFFQTLNWFKELIPMLLGIIIIVAMLKQAWIFESISKYINNNFWWVVLADIFWSISVWNTINSYIIADSFWKIDNYILVITAFLISWVTVWIIQIPAESYFFGKKFVILRNILSFLFAIVGAYLVYFLYNL